MKGHFAELLEDWTTPLDDGVVFGLCCFGFSVAVVFVGVMAIIAAIGR